MSNWCRVLNGIVQEIIQSAIDPNGSIYHSSLLWVQDTSGLAQIGWNYAGGAFYAPTATQINQSLKPQAMLALDKSDLVAFRCFKAGVAFPFAWQSYTIALRNIVNGTDTTSTVLPIQPAYPAGT